MGLPSWHVLSRVTETNVSPEVTVCLLDSCIRRNDGRGAYRGRTGGLPGTDGGLTGDGRGAYRGRTGGLPGTDGGLTGDGLEVRPHCISEMTNGDIHSRASRNP